MALNSPAVAELERSLGSSIRRTRLAAGLTQSDLAEQSNVSRSTIQQLEQGEGSSLTTLIRVARALNRTDWLAAFTPPAPSISPMSVLRERQLVEATARRRVSKQANGLRRR